MGQAIRLDGPLVGKIEETPVIEPQRILPLLLSSPHTSSPLPASHVPSSLERVGSAEDSHCGSFDKKHSSSMTAFQVRFL